MGKHDKEEELTVEINEIEYYKERNQTLARENIELRRKLDKEAEAYEHGDLMHKHVIVELEARIAELEAENEKLRAFKEKIVKAVVS